MLHKRVVTPHHGSPCRQDRATMVLAAIILVVALVGCADGSSKPQARQRMIGVARLRHQSERAFEHLVLAGAAGKIKLSDLQRRVTALLGTDHKTRTLRALTHARVDSTSATPRGYDTWKNYLLGWAAEQARQRPAATGFFVLSAQSDQSFWPARAALVKVLAAQGHFAAAQQQAWQYVHDSRFGTKAWRLLVNTYATQDRLAHALKLALSLRTKYPQDRKIALTLAALYHRRGQLAHQLRTLESIVAVFPNHAQAYSLLIDLADDMEHWKLAAHYRRIFVHKFPTSTMAAIFVAARHVRQGHPQRAVQIFRADLRAHPYNVQFRKALIGIYALLHQPQNAAAAIVAAQPPSGRCTLAQTRDLVVCYLAAGQKKLCVQIAARRAARHPQSPRWQIFYAQILGECGQRGRAATVLENLTIARPHSARAIEAWTDALTVGAHPMGVHRAVAAMQRFIRSNGATPAWLVFLANLEIAAGEDQAMVQTYQQVLTLMPANATANNDLGYYWAGRHIHLVRAQRMIQLAVKNYPRESAFRDSLGWVLYQRGKNRQALVEFAKALVLPEGISPVGLEHYADALYRLNRVSAAIAVWQKALILLPTPTASSPHARMVRRRLTQELGRAKALQNLVHSKASQRM